MKEDTSALQKGSTESGDASPAAERRRTSRQPVDRPVTLRLADAGNLGPVPARLVDLSAGGIGLRLPRPLAPGKQFTLEVGNPTTAAAGNGEAFALRYVVVRCRPLGHGSFHVGARFVRTPTPVAAGKVSAPRACTK